MTTDSRSVKLALLPLTLTLIVGLTLPSCSYSTLTRRGVSQVELPPSIRLAFSPAWSPTGSKVAFVGYTSQTEEDIYILDVASRVATPVKLPQARFASSHPNWSPDETSMTFWGTLISQQKTGIWKVYSDSRTEFLTSGYEAAWSPDGSRLAVLDSAQEYEQIRIVDVETGESKIIFSVQTASNSPLSDLSWSPDGNALAFIMPAEVNGYLVDQLYRVDSDGSNVDLLLANHQMGSAADPKWILGGGWIAVLLESGSDWTLNFVAANGQCVIAPLADLRPLSSMDILSDGTKIVVESRGDLYMVDTQEALAPRSLEETLKCP